MDSNQAEKSLRDVVRRMAIINDKLRDWQIIDLCDGVSRKVVADLRRGAKSILEAVNEIRAVQGDR